MISTNGQVRKHRTPLKTIRLKCLDCSCGQPREVRLCPVEQCPLWPYRMGVRPGHRRAGEANEDARHEKLRARPTVSSPEAVSAGGGSSTTHAPLPNDLAVTTVGLRQLDRETGGAV